MRKMMLLVLALVLVLGMLLASACAAERKQCGDFVYETQPDGTAAILQYTGTSTEIVVPEEVDGLPVTLVMYLADRPLRNTITSIWLPDSVTGFESIAEYPALKTLRLSPNITTISYIGLMYNTSLESLEVPEGVTSIQGSAFKGCYSLTDITLPASLVKLPPDEGIFPYPNDAHPNYHLTIHGYEGTLASRMANNSYISFVPIEEDRQSSDGYQYVIQNGESVITGYIGAGGDLTIPETLGGCPVTAIRACAFSGNDDLTGVTVPASVKQIGNAAFMDCPYIAQVTLSEGLESIGAYAFVTIEDIYEMDDDFVAPEFSIAVPESVTSIGRGAFVHEIIVKKGSYAERYGVFQMGGCTYPDGTHSEPLEVRVSENRDDTLTVLGWAWTLDEKPSTLEIPERILGLPVTQIANYAFEADAPTRVILPDTVTYIGYSAFRGYSDEPGSLAYIRIPASVKLIEEDALAGCPKLTASVARGSVGDAYCAQYSIPVVCHDFGHADVVIPADANVISDEAFAMCTDIRSVAVAEGVATIGARAFAGCVAMETVYIPASVTVIGEDVFDDCPAALTVVTPRDSHAAQYCAERDIRVVFTDD